MLHGMRSSQTRERTHVPCIAWWILSHWATTEAKLSNSLASLALCRKVLLLFSHLIMSETLCDPMNCSTPGLPVLHYLPEFAQTHVHWVNDAIQPSHPLSSPLLFPSVFPSIRVFSKELTLPIRWPKFGASVSAPVLLKNIHSWFPLGLTGLILLLSKWLSPHSCLIFEPITDSSKWFFTYTVKNLQEVSK